MLSDHKGIENVLDALRYTISAQMPAKVTAINAATSAQVQSWLAGPYVIPAGGKTFLWSKDNGTENTITVAAGTYTATTLAAALNADATFAAVLTASTEMAGGHLIAYVTTRGSAGSIKIGAGTINAYLGWRATSFVANYLPTRNLAFVEVTYLDDVPWSYPACTLWCNGAKPQRDKDHISYDVTIRLRETIPTPEPVVLLGLLSRMARAVFEILTSDTNAESAFGGKLNLVLPPSYAPATNLYIDPENKMVGQIDLTTEVVVQE